MTKARIRWNSSAPAVQRAWVLALLAPLLVWPATPLLAEEDLVVLAEIGPWPVVSRLIGYGDRLWFANSVKGRNHNSADVYSYDLNTDDVRYERHLFSQDAGRPVVADDLLYWPFEDARFSIGYGHFMITDGERWHQGVIPTGRIFHNHAMTAGDQLVAATSAWRAHLDVSSDGGASWHQVYDHPTPERRVSRIVELTTLGPLTFGSLNSRDLRTLMRFDGFTADPVPGWPTGQHVLALTAYRDHVYGLVRTADGPTIWRTDGELSDWIAGPDGFATEEDGTVARDLIADERGLWVLTTSAIGGWIWHSSDGKNWTRRYGFANGHGVELSSYRGRLFLGGTDEARGIGLLWGVAGGRSTERATDDPAKPAKKRRFPKSPPPSTRSVDWEALAKDIDQRLADPAMYQGHGRQLRDLVFDLLSAGPPAGFLARRLHADMPDEPLSLIGGAVQVSSALMGRAVLLWGLSQLGEIEGGDVIPASDRVPLQFLTEPWTTPPNRAEKYFDTPPFALWAVASIGQNDRATINALIERLTQPGDPLWLRGDVVGALTALTEQRFAYNAAAWRQWWVGARAFWP